MEDYCLVVTSFPAPGQEAEYNDWYSNQHLADVLDVPGFVSARRFVTETSEGKQYLALYNIRTSDPDACMAELTARAGTEKMGISPALDMPKITMALYRAITKEVETASV